MKISPLNLLADLVAIPSVNPRVLGGRDTDSEQQLSRFVADTLRAEGIDVELQEVEPGRCNVIAHVARAGSADDNVVLLSAHMDTYPSSEPDQHDFRPRIADGFLHGRGSADAKGSLAAMMAASIEAARSPNRREHYVVGSIDEEFGLTGARRLAAHGLRADLAVTGEPTRLQPIVGQKGIVRFCLRIDGTASHAAYPSPDNAILKTGRLLAGVQEFIAELADAGGHPQLGAATLTPTRLVFDGDMNKSPKCGRLFFDARFLPGDSAECFVERLIARVAQGLDFQDFELEPLLFVSPSNLSRTDTVAVRDFFAAIRGHAGVCEAGYFNYGSEAGVLADIADASMVFGPGDPKYSHGPGERVSIEELAMAASIYGELLTGRAG